MVFGEINSFLNIWDRFRKWNTSRKTPIATPVETVAARFVRLFESHGVHRNQIPRFFGYGLTLKDVQDDVSLIVKLDEDMLAAACARFAVRREWLDVAESQIHPDHDFYKYPEKFLSFLNELRVNNPEGELWGTLIAPEEHDWRAEALLILQETVGLVGDKPIYRFHLCNNWSFSYWKSRGYLTACVAIAWGHQVFIHGTTMPKKEIEQLAYGETLLGWQGEGIWFLGNQKWYPEDMALQPDAYLEGIDPERDNFGIAAGLGLWLKLEEQGFMGTGIRADAKQLFQQELAKYTSS
jgi:hypothetical protein